MRIERAERPYSAGVVVVVLRPPAAVRGAALDDVRAAGRPGGDRRARRCPPGRRRRGPPPPVITALPGRSLAMSALAADQLIGGPTAWARCRAPMAAISAGSGGPGNCAK